MTEIAIIGAGPAGLMAAWQAAKKGHQVTVYERSSFTGGMSASFELAGQNVDFGSHRLHPATPPHLLEEIKKLNQGFITSIEKKRPYIALKLAMSLNGKIATQTKMSNWISGEKSRNFVQLRACKYQV